MRLKVIEEETEFKTKTWTRVTVPRWGSHRLGWTKSGERSLVHNVPYQIFEKWFGPTKLTETNIPTITKSVRLGIKKQISKSKWDLHDTLITIKYTLVFGKDTEGKILESSDQARTVYGRRRSESRKRRKSTTPPPSSSGRTYYTKRVELVELNFIINQMREQCFSFLQKGGSPIAWLVVIQVTIYLPEGSTIRKN